MSIIVKQSEPNADRRTFTIGPFAYTVGGAAYEGALAGADLQIIKNGVSANSGGTATHIADGYFKYVFLAAEFDTLGDTVIKCAKSGLFPDATRFSVRPVDFFDSASLGLSRIDVANSTRLAATDYEDLVAMLDAADTIEIGLTLRNALRLLAAYAAGNVTGGGSGTEAFKAAVDSTKTRFTSFPTSAGSRTVTYDFS
jgi:hypothetical protein